VVTSGALLALTGEGLQFASIVALTVAFGLGLNATIHYLNRLRLEDHPGRDPTEAAHRATVLIGPALILTSIVLACGLAITVFSDLPSLRIFGRLSATTLIAAMFGGLFLLPACMLLVKRTEAAGRRMRPVRGASAKLHGSTASAGQGSADHGLTPTRDIAILLGKFAGYRQHGRHRL
jgi:uncharacterized membrane protein YdfJ with MMPL/SSD domain